MIAPSRTRPKVWNYPVNLGGDYRYAYVLNAGDQTVSVIDCSTDTVVATITLTSGKDFVSLFYRPLNRHVYVLGYNSYIEEIDADSGSATFNTIVASYSFGFSSVSPIIASYLPPPFDIITVGGTSKTLEGNDVKIWKHIKSDGRFPSTAHFRMGGHSNTPNIVYYHRSGVIQANKQIYRVTGNNNYRNTLPYYIERHPTSLPYNDLQAINTPVILFSNFCFVATGNNIYALDTTNAGSGLMIYDTGNLTASSRTIQEYCPNTPGKIYFASQITDNTIDIFTIDYNNMALSLEETIDRSAYKATNESGANFLGYNPYNGRLYAQANNNSNVTGVNKIHVYDPTAAVGSRYVKSITVGEMKSSSRASTYALNTMCFNGLRLYEYPNERL